MQKYLLIVAFAGLVFFSFFKLSESPGTWTDEGLIIQTSQNLATQSVYGFQVAPGNIISPSFISTSYPVTFPIALVFKLFGVKLLHARVIMALFIILLGFMAWKLLKLNHQKEALLGLLLLASYPPLYGNGKNVLGEIPGLFYLFVGAYFLLQIEKGRNTKLNFFWMGIFLGLSVATKPIFILAAPPFLLVVIVLYRSKLLENFKQGISLVVGGIVPLVVWICVQFTKTDGVQGILSYYSNPHSVDIGKAVLANLTDTFTHFHPLFALVILVIWIISVIKVYKKEKIWVYELFLVSFACLVFLLYFRNPSYYRYFLISEIPALVFLPIALSRLSLNIRWQKIAPIGLALLIVLQFYQLGFSSWVASAYRSHQSEIMAEAVGNLDPKQTLFIYQAPEIVPFLPHNNYYQYFSGTRTTFFGREGLEVLKNKKDVLIITKKDLVSAGDPMFEGYKIIKEFHKYALLGIEK